MVKPVLNAACEVLIRISSERREAELGVGSVMGFRTSLTGPRDEKPQARIVGDGEVVDFDMVKTEGWVELLFTTCP